MDYVLPSSLHTIKHTKHTLATRVQNTTLYSDGKGVQPNGSPARTITVSHDMRKAFYTINIHTLIRKLLQTKIPDPIIKFFANYIKGRKSYTKYRNHTSSQRTIRWRPFTNTIQHLHYRHATTKSISSGHGLHRLHHHQIYTHKHEYSQEIHTTITFLAGQNTLNPDKTTCTIP